MSRQAAETSVRGSIVVEAPIERAFAVFTDEIGSVKPPDHNLLDVEIGATVFSWDISAQWQIETDFDKTSEVEVRFVAEALDRTRVELEHRNLDRHGEGWEAERDGVGGDQGWPLYLDRFAERIAA